MEATKKNLARALPVLLIIGWIAIGFVLGLRHQPDKVDFEQCFVQRGGDSQICVTQTMTKEALNNLLQGNRPLEQLSR